MNRDSKEIACQKLASLSYRNAMQHYGFQSNEPDDGNLCMAQWDPDGSMIVGVHETAESRGLLVWDFRLEREHDRHFLRTDVGDMKLWLCFDTL